MHTTPNRHSRRRWTFLAVPLVLLVSMGMLTGCQSSYVRFHYDGSSPGYLEVDVTASDAGNVDGYVKTWNPGVYCFNDSNQIEACNIDIDGGMLSPWRHLWDKTPNHIGFKRFVGIAPGDDIVVNLSAPANYQVRVVNGAGVGVWYRSF